MNTIKEEIIKSISARYDLIDKDIAEKKRLIKSVENIINGIFNGNWSAISTCNTLSKANKLYDTLSDELEFLYKTKQYASDYALDAYNVQINKHKAIAARYKPKNKLMKRRPL